MILMLCLNLFGIHECIYHVHMPVTVPCLDPPFTNQQTVNQQQSSSP